MVVASLSTQPSPRLEMTTGECWSEIKLKADVSPLQRRLLSGRTRRCAGRHARMAIHNMATHY